MVQDFNKDKKNFLDGNLYTLYIEIATVTAELKLLSDQIDIKDPTTQKHINKIVFQFFYQHGLLTLAIFVSGRNGQGFGSTFNLILKKSDCTSQYSIDGQDVYLGDQEINNQDNGWADLKSWISGKKYKFLAFKPNLVPSDINNGNGMGGSSIIYTIYPVINKSDLCIVPTNLATTLKTNPSPPHHGN